MSEKTLQSTHILMFPFVFAEDVESVNNLLLQDKLWDYKKFDVADNTQNYNEYIYFYEYVRKTLFSTEPVDAVQTSYYFEYKEQKGKYLLEVNDNKYTLDIDGISMRTFDTQVGILSIELLNYNYADPEEILLINDFARRLYPQFLAGKDNLEEITNNLLPQSVTLELDREIKEDFSYYKDLANVGKDATNLPRFIHALLGEGFSSHAQAKESSKIHIEPIIDDRMFVISMYMNDDLAKKMQAYDEGKEVYAYENDEYWYKYIFVDTKDKMCQSKHMTKKLIKETTYDRWVEWGTLYGISRYSFVALTTKEHGSGILKPHMHTMYFQIFTLLLSYRASMLNFSRRVSEVTVGEKTPNDLQLEVEKIYKDYINFENKLFFREVTAQEQGIEIYNQALKVMQIEKHIKDLDSEIAELHTYVSMKTENQRNDRLENISNLGAVFLPPALIAGIYGVNIFDFNQSTLSMGIGLAAMGASALIGYLGIKKKINVWFASALMVGTIAVSIYAIGDKTDKPLNHHQSHIIKKEKK